MKLNRKDRSTALLATFLVGLVILWAGAQYLELREAQEAPRTDSKEAKGFRHFFELKEKLRPASAVAIRRPILKISDLEPFDTYVIASPRMQLTIRETEILRDWVMAGGHLIIAFHDEETKTRLNSFVDDLTGGAADSIKGHPTPDIVINSVPGFKNGATTKVIATSEKNFLKPNETYEFYSRIRLQDYQCLEDETQCFVRSNKVGDGKVTAFIGLAPFSNALIMRSDNSKLAARLALATGRVGFDEFHLFLTEKTKTDLLMEPSFGLPLFGILIGVLLFFLTASGDAEEALLVAPKRTNRSSRSMHNLGRLILRRVVESGGSLPDAANKHATFLKRMFPKEQNEISAILEKVPPAKTDEDTSAWLNAARNLIQVHKNWLKSRGRG